MKIPTNSIFSMTFHQNTIIMDLLPPSQMLEYPTWQALVDALQAHAMTQGYPVTIRLHGPVSQQLIPRNKVKQLSGRQKNRKNAKETGVMSLRLQRMSLLLRSLIT